MGGSQITLTSTTDPIEAVQAALGVTPDAAAAAAEPAKVPETPAADAAPATPAVDAAPAANATVATPAADVKTDAVAAVVPTADAIKPDKKREKGSLQARIDELVEQRDTARGMSAAQEAELKGLRRRVEELSAGAPQKAAADTGAAVVEDVEPKVEDFPDYDTYVKASIQFHAKKVAADMFKESMATAGASAQQQAAQHAQAEMLQAHEGRLTEAKAVYDDYDEVVGKPGMMISVVMRDGIISSDIGPHVAYHLANHPEEREKLFALGDTPQAIRAFGRLEQKVADEVSSRKASASVPAGSVQTSAATAAASDTTPAAAAPAAPAAPVKLATSAPDPLSPVGGTSVTSTVSMDKLSYADYKKLREDQLKARRASGARV